MKFLSIASLVSLAAGAAILDGTKITTRANIDRSCSDEQQEIINTALKNSVALARAGAKAARSGPASRMNKIFKRSDEEARRIVADAFDKVVQVYGGDGVPTIHCDDPDGYCAENVNTTAYCIPERSVIQFCSGWYNRYADMSSSCGWHDRTVIAVHEATHLDEVKSTIDNEGQTDNLNHADSYGKFAHQAYLNCPS